MFESTSRSGRVWAAGVTLAVAATAWTGMPGSTATATAGASDGCVTEVLTAPQRAGKVAKSKPAAFKKAAQRNGQSVRSLTEAAEDATLWLDECGKQFFVEPRAAAPVAANRAEAQPNTGVPLADTFTLQSKPGSNRTIYLDFNGGTVSGTGWNDGDTDIVVTPYSMDSTVSTSFSDAELTQIQAAWQVVAEDYAPFDINVTTRDLGLAAIDRTDSNDQTFGSHVYMTNGGSIYDGCGCGGVAYVGVFSASGSSHAYYQPAWVFANGTGTSGKSMAEAASHEVGHNFGLDHDGTSTRGYYTGADPWAPIMGVGYSQPVVQWSVGEYPDANNKEDDLSIIAQGAPFRADDHGNNASGATTLPAGGSVNGIIGNRADVDAFKITGSGPTTVTLKGAAGVPNLDAKLTILNASGATVATVDPASARVSSGVASGLDASWTGDLPAGGATYTVLVDGVGTGNPLTAGKYSDYGSLGNFQLALTTGTVATNTVTVTNPGAQTGTVGTAKSLQIQASDSAAGQTLTYSATGLPAGMSINSSTGLISGTPTAAATSSTTVTVKDSTNATGTTTFSWTISPATSSCSGQKLGNPGFETGSAAPWTASSGVIDNATYQPARSGSWKAWLNGYGSTHTDKLSQTVTIPAGCKANLSFYLHIDTKEGATQNQYDKLELRVGTTKVAGFSNVDAAAGYARRSYNLSVFAGQTVTIAFTGTEDYSLKTSFVIDDAALNLY